MAIPKFFKIITVSLFVAFCVPVHSFAINNTPLSDSAADVKIAAQIVKRVYEIQAMDKSNLSPAEKKSLKKELQTMKAQADGLNRGVYLSVGAIIIILLILILIL